MIPFQKLFTILIRTFSRPMLGYFKKKQQIHKNNMIGSLFIGLGRGTITFQSWMNHKVLKKPASHKSVEIKEEILLEKGVQTFYQIFFYLIVLGLPFWQLYKGSLASQKKQEALQKRIQTLDKKLQQVNKQLKKTVQFLKKQHLQNPRKTALKSTQNIANQSNNKLQIDGKTSSTQNQQIKSIQIQEHLQNALQVVADEFEGILDDLQPQFQAEVTSEEGDSLDLQAEIEDSGGDASSAQISAETSTEDIGQMQ